MKSNSKANLNNLNTSRNNSSRTVSASNVSLKSGAIGTQDPSKIANFSKSDEACTKEKLSNSIESNGFKQPHPQHQQQQPLSNSNQFQFMNNAHLGNIANLLTLQNLLINEQALVDALVKIQLLANQQQQIQNVAASLQANDLAALRNKLTQYMRQQNTSHSYLNYLTSLLSTFTSPTALSTFISSLPSSLQQLCTQMQQTQHSTNQNGILSNNKSQTLVNEKIKNSNLNAAGGDASVQNNADGQQAQFHASSSSSAAAASASAQKTISPQQEGDNSTSKTTNNSIIENPQSKYPLECSWSFWFFKNNRDSDWKENLTLLTTVDNVEDFWAVYNHLRPVSHLHEGCDYMLFKKGIKPMWEDDENRNGGRWLVSFDKEKRSQSLDTYWLHTLLSLIGSHYDDESGIVNGAVVNIRYKTDKLSLWTKSYDNEDAQNRIVCRFKKVLGIKEGPLIYEIHERHY